MFSNKVDICGINTSKLKVLTSAEKEQLLIEAKNGNAEARSKLIDGILKLVLSVIQRFNNRGENLDDLFQVGCIGLIKAVDNFDISIGVKFSTYAVPMIIGEIRRYLRDNNAIRVSRSMRDLAYKALQAKEMLAKNSDKAVERAIKGMLPKNTLGRQMYRKLKVYKGDTHPHAAQTPRKYALVGGKQ